MMKYSNVVVAGGGVPGQPDCFSGSVLRIQCHYLVKKRGVYWKNTAED